MFSTPQSKAFFSQEIVKGKLIAEQLQLVNQIHERVWETKGIIQEVLKILLLPNEQISLIEQKLTNIEDNIECAYELVFESNEIFSFEVSLRNDIKHLQHTFFKSIMALYQQKIKQLKHSLLLLQHEVQELEQKGLLPYVQNPDKNNIMAAKNRNYIEYRQKIQLTERVLNFSRKKILQKLIITIVNEGIQQKKQNSNISEKKGDLNHKLQAQQLNKSQEIKSPPQLSFVESKTITQLVKKSSSDPLQILIKKQKPKQFGVAQMLELLYQWLMMTNNKIKNSNRLFKRRIESLSLTNKSLKEGIRYIKQIMNFEQNEAMVRKGEIELTREQAIDFLREMHQDLQQRFQKRNIYMIVSSQMVRPKTKSCTNLKLIEEEQVKQSYPCLKQINNNLNNSFLEQCSYLISDRFMADQDQNQQMIV